MGLIKCVILTRAKDLEIEYISSSKRDFDHNGALYLIPNELCNISIINGIIKKQPKLFYTEGTPYPVSTSQKLYNMHDTLDDKIFENFINQATNSQHLDILGFFKKIGWRNFLISLGVVGVIYWIITGVFA